MNDNQPGRRRPQDHLPEKERARRERAHEEAQLDESIEESFPASDPSSVTRAPREHRYTVEPPEEGADRRTPANPGPEA
ncbi:hypothetical protein ACFFJB_04270 [Camelimonas abortus]|uniref:Uncharacterized protein n=1 Tax=Camelimonas abortus TaxID=1017184 RepID=A0ABV7LFH6_9HYPH